MNNRLSLLSLCTVLLLNPVLISKCYAKNADESTDKLSIEVKRAIDENTRGKALSCFITDKELIKDQDLSATVEVYTNNSTKIKMLTLLLKTIDCVSLVLTLERPIP